MGLIEGVVSQSADTRKASLSDTNTLYKQNATQWKVGLDAYDATGGFLDGSYLWPFPREDDEQISRRRQQARYHNYVETLVDIYVRHVTTGVERSSDDAGLMAWWDDVDNQGSPMTSYMESVLGQALAAGHAGVLVDKAAQEPAGPAVADDRSRPYLQTFSAPDIRDWREDQNGLAAVKLSEAAPPVDLSSSDQPKPGYLLWDRDIWARFDAEGLPTGDPPLDAHSLGVVPFLTVRPKPSRRHPFIGKPLVTPSLIQAHYNRASEEDLVLRDQAFSLFMIQVPIDAQEEHVQQAKDMLAGGVGTTTVAVVRGSADFKTADMQVPETLRVSEQALVHEMFRMAHLRFQRDSLQAESAEAMRLQRVDLDAALRAIAEQLQRVEEQIAWLYFAWTTTNPDQAMERANVQVNYPDQFSLIDIEEELTAIGAAIALELGQTAGRELRKRAVTLTLPNLSEKTLEAVKAEIENAQTGVASDRDSLREQAAERLRAQGVEVEAA
jgi:hypothetical protein